MSRSVYASLQNAARHVLMAASNVGLTGRATGNLTLTASAVVTVSGFLI